MATHLNIEEQEQLDRLKQLWKQYGNLVIWVVILALGGFAAFSQWQSYQRSRAGDASVLYDEIEVAAQAADLKKAERVFADMRERYASTVATAQAGLLNAKLQFDAGQPDAARASLEWVAANAPEAEYKVMAKLRLAGVLLDQKKFDEAIAALPGDAPGEFAALVNDRRGDILHAQGKNEDAKAAYRAAYDAMEQRIDYRRLIEAKMTSLGTPSPAAASGPASVPASGAASAPPSVPAPAASRAPVGAAAASAGASR